MHHASCGPIGLTSSSFRLRCWFFLLIALLATLNCACNGDDDGLTIPPITPTDTANRTVLIYMAAQNSLGSGGWQQKDSVEIMLGRQFVASTNRLLVFIDDAKAPRLYRVIKEWPQPVLVRSWDTDVNSTSPEVLSDVLRWTRTNFPAREYGLVMWSHADGWIPATDKDYTSNTRRRGIQPYSFGIDDGSRMGTDTGTQMDVDDMAAAITAAQVHLRFLFFDACLMQNFEVAYALKDVTDYLIASPISTPAAGSNYTHQLRDAFFDTDPTNIVTTYYADVTDKTQQSSYADYGIVVSAIRTDRLDALAEAFSEALPISALAGRTSPNMDGVLNYQAYSWNYFYRPHNYDAAEAVRRLFPENAQPRLLQAINDAVVRKAATTEFWIGPGYSSYKTVPTDSYCGVSMFVPQTAYTLNAGACPHGDHNANFTATRWYAAAGWAQTGW